MVIFAWIKGVKDEQKPHFTGSIESDPIDCLEWWNIPLDILGQVSERLITTTDWSLQDIERLKDEVYKLQKKEP